MNNAAIINMHQNMLVKEGILKYTGKVIHCKNLYGEPFDIPIVETIHTYNGWKERGYQVKKGEKAVAKFPIWKYIDRKAYNGDNDELRGSQDGEDDRNKGKCMLKTAAFFTEAQVEKIKEEN